MLGVEMIDPTGKPDRAGQPPHGGDLARAVQSEACRAGLILETGGRHGSVLRFLPPLTISDAEIDQVSNILSDTFSRLGRNAA